jgi:HEAT repeat protein
MKKYILSCCFLVSLVFLQAQEIPQAQETPQVPAETPQAPVEEAAKPGKTVDEQRLELIRYGTESEIAELIKILRNELMISPASSGVPAEPAPETVEAAPDTPLDTELKRIAGTTKNRSILSGIFSFFADRKKDGLEERAVQVLEDRYDEANETVLAVIDYLGKLSVYSAADSLKEIINEEESAFLSSAIRALGRTAKKGDADAVTEFLVEFYEQREPAGESRREIVSALGETGSPKGIPLLSEIADNDDAGAPLRMAALASLSKIGDEEGLEVILKSVSAADPNVRASAIAALGPFSGEKADSAIIEAFRDSYYRTRLAAAQAARERKLKEAIPFLRYRSEHDEVPQVRDEAIKALGSIGTGEAEDILEELFKERKNSDRVRIAAGEMLLANSPDKYTEKVIVELDEAKKKSQTALYNGFLRILGKTKTNRLEALARRFLALGSIEEKSYAIDICSNNEFRGLADELKKLAEGKNQSLSRKAKRVLEKWGLE